MPSGIEVEITGDMDKLLKLDQDILFAVASSLTKATKEAQAGVVAALKSDFTIRGRWYEQASKTGIRVKAAKKDDLESVLYTGADWLLESEGFNAGLKTPDKHSGHLTAPAKDKRTGRIEARTGGLDSGKIRKDQKAKYLLDHTEQTRAFKIKTKSGYTLILQRKGRKGQSTVVTKYIFRDEVQVPHHSAIIEPTEQIIPQVFPRIFDAQLKTAVETSRLKEEKA